MYKVSFPESKIKFNRSKTLKKCEGLVEAALELCDVVPAAGSKHPLFVRVNFVDVVKGVASMRGRIKIVGLVGSANPRAILAKVQPDDNTSGRTITLAFADGAGKLIGLKNPKGRDPNWDIPLILEKLMSGAGSAVDAVDELKKKKKEAKKQAAQAGAPSVMEVVQKSKPVREKRNKLAPEDLGAPLTTSLGAALKEAVSENDSLPESSSIEAKGVPESVGFPSRRILPERFSEKLSGFILWLEENSFLPELVSRWKTSLVPYVEDPSVMVVDTKICTNVLREMFDFNGHNSRAVGAVFREFVRKHDLFQLHAKGKDRSFYVLNEKEAERIKKEHRLDVSYEDPTNIEVLPSIGSVIEYLICLWDVFGEGPMFVPTVKMIGTFRKFSQEKISDIQIVNSVLGVLGADKKSNPPKTHEGVLEVRDDGGVSYWSISNKGLSLMKDFGLFADEDVRTFVQKKQVFVADFFGRGVDIDVSEETSHANSVSTDTSPVDFKDIEGKPLEILQSAGKEIRLLLEGLERDILSGASHLAEMRESLSNEGRRQAIESAMVSIEEFPEEVLQEFMVFAKKLLAETSQDRRSQEEVERYERLLDSLDEEKSVLSEVSAFLE